MGGSPDVPKVPDPTVTANSQFDMNKQAGTMSQQGSMVNQSNPYGSLNYSQTGTSPDGTPLYSQSTTLSPANQQLLDILNGTKTTAGGQGSALISGANYGAQQPGTVIGDATSGLVKDAMAKQVAYLQPQMDYDIDRKDTQLRNQGFAPGDPGYDRAMNALKQSQGQTITGFESTIEPQMFNQSMQSYLMPAQLGSMLSGFGSPTMPTWNNTPNLNIQSPDLIGATNSANTANMAAYKAQNDQNNAMMSGLFGIPSSILGGMAKGGAFNGALSGLMGAGGLGAAGAGAADAGLASLAALGPMAII